MPRKLRELATTPDAPDVSDEIYAFRQVRCRKCPYTRKAGDNLYCVYRGCPM